MYNINTHTLIYRYLYHQRLYTPPPPTPYSPVMISDVVTSPKNFLFSFFLRHVMMFYLRLYPLFFRFLCFKFFFSDIFYVILYVLYNIYLFYSQYVVYLHNEDKEHNHMYLVQTIKRRMLFL